MGYVELACRLVVSAVFLVAVLAKLKSRQDFAAFVATLVDLRLVRRSWAGAVAGAAVCLEIAIPVLLMMPATVPSGFVLTGATCLVFASVIGWALRRGARTACRCFGESTTPLGPVHVLRNILLIVIASLGLVAGTKSYPHPQDAAGVAITLAAAGVIVLIVRFLDEIIGAFSGPTRSSP